MWAGGAGFFYPAEQEEASVRRSVAVGGGSGRALPKMPQDGHASTAGPNPRHLVVAWWVQEDIKDLCEGLSQWLPAGSSVTVICSEEPVVSISLSPNCAWPCNICFQLRELW
jgi:hypothetical protein